MKPRTELLLLLGLALCLRLAFINQAFQLDDPTYLGTAQYAQSDPWHPSHYSLVFMGERVSMRGHPHPPLDAWILALALALTGSPSEVPLHACYLVFTLVSVGAMYALARRFTSRPLLATLLFMATPAFVVHGNGLESDLPLLAFWMAGAAAFVYSVDRDSAPLLVLSLVSLALATLAAYQAVFLAPALALYAWMRKRSWKQAALASAVPVAVIAGYQLYERLSGGTLPAAMFLHYMRQDSLQSLANKLGNALALTAHLGWVAFPPLALVAFLRPGRVHWFVAGAAAALAAIADSSPLFWIPFGVGVLILASAVLRLRDRDTGEVFLRVWILVFFAGALAIFYAGAARYLLPLVGAVAMLAVRALDQRPRWLVAAVLLQFPVSLALAASHYQHSGAYRDFALQLAPRIAAHRTFVNGEWGFQYYGQKAGGQPLLRTTELQAGDWLLTSKLGFPLTPRLAPGTARVLVREVQVIPAVPLRLIGINGRSAFSSISFGVRPFDVLRAPADILTAEQIVAREPVLSYVSMSDAGAGDQIVSGIYNLESNRYRWMGARAVLLLKRPEERSRVEVQLYIPSGSPARRVTLTLDDTAVAERAFPGPGTYTLVSDPVSVAAASSSLAIAVDRTFTVAGDQRQLGIILTAAGFQPVK